MKRLKKAVLLPIRHMAHRWRRLSLYYWAERQLFDLQAVWVMPIWYYRWLFHTCMWMVDFKICQRVVNRAIHTIPYPVRFEAA